MTLQSNNLALTVHRLKVDHLILLLYIMHMKARYALSYNKLNQ